MCVHTLAKNSEYGKPLSLANAHVCLDAVASSPIVAKMAMAMRMAVMAVVPALDCVAL